MTIHEFGKENKETIILIHPSVVKWDYFENVIPLLEKNYHLLVPALPGYDFDNDNDFTSVEQIASDLNNWIKAKGFTEIYAVYGCSMGGSVALMVALGQKVRIQWPMGTEGRHTRVRLRQGNDTLFASIFGVAPQAFAYPVGSEVEAALEVSVFNGCQIRQQQGDPREKEIAGTASGGSLRQPLYRHSVLVDRKKLKNPNGLILGTPGSGKSFSAKREITNAFLVTDDDIIVNDPEGEVRHEVA